MYIAAIAYLFDQHTLGISEHMSAIDDPAERLECVIAEMLEVSERDPRFRRIYLRELLEGDEKKLSALAENAFAAFYEPLYELMGELAPGRDQQLLIFSMAGMIFHHLETRKLAPSLPHALNREIEVGDIARHITGLFLRGAKSS